MSRSLACALLSGLSLLTVALPSVAEPVRPILETTVEGSDLRVVVKGVTDYCSTDADTTVLRGDGTIRIVRDRPAHVSRCFATRDVAFIVKDVAPGTYRVTYERIPAVAPARALTVASGTAVVASPSAPRP